MTSLYKYGIMYFMTKYRIVKRAFVNSENVVDYRYIPEFYNPVGRWGPCWEHVDHSGGYITDINEAKKLIEDFIKLRKAIEKCDKIPDEIIEYPEVE